MKNIIAISVPTGAGAEIGGFAGDAGHIARMFSEHFRVIVNPNVVNAGTLSAINNDMLYVEGYAFDDFFGGNINLEPVTKFNKIGVIFDRAIPDNILNIHLNTIEAAKIVKNYNIPFFELTDENTGISLMKDSSGISSGRVHNEKTLYKAAEKLIKKGVEALAVVCFFGDECEDENYNNGAGVDPIGGIEAVISHYLTKEFMAPTAHSPAFSRLDISFKRENYKVASEFISSTYLPCILDGLSMAPKLLKNGQIKRDDVKCLIVPKDTLGSKAVLSCCNTGIDIFAVKNKTVLSIDCNKLKESDIIGNIIKSNIVEFESYWDCLNFIKDKYE